MSEVVVVAPAVPTVPTWKTTSFWAALFIQVGLILSNVIDVVPAQWALWLSAGNVVAYFIGRTITKYRADLNRGYKSTEFWLAILLIAQGAVEAFQDTVPNIQVAAVIAGIASVYKIARALQTARMVDVGVLTPAALDSFLVNNTDLKKGDLDG